jgi:CHAT domain-containing protein
VGRQPRFTACRAVVGATAERLRRAVARHRPNVVHYVGHGHFDERTGIGTVALCSPDGDTDWIDEDHLADLLCSDDWAPAVVVLHACEGGRNHFEYRHAGLAPGLVRHGVHSVVAMQYPVTNETAIAFSVALYQAIAQAQYLDEAVQSAREAVYAGSRHDGNRDARLLGVPMIYQLDAAPLLGIPAPAGGCP